MNKYERFLGEKGTIAKGAFQELLSSRPNQKPPFTDMLNPVCIIFIGIGVLATTLRLNRDSRCASASLHSISANRLPGLGNAHQYQVVEIASITSNIMY
jgi:hypothetical protein